MKYFALLLCLLTGGLYAQDSREGYWLPVRGKLRVFLVYAEVANDPDEPGPSGGWEPGKLPVNPGYFFDHELKAGETPRGILTQYYHQASFGEFLVLADYYPRLITVDYQNLQGKGFRQVMDTVLQQTGRDVITAHGYSVNEGDFDAFSPGYGYGSPKQSRPDSIMDMVMVIWRVNSRITTSSSGGYCMPYRMTYPFKGMKGFMSYSYFVNEGASNYVILRHEFSHLLLGGNNFHTGGSGAGTRTFLSSAGGYAMLSSWDRSSQVYNAFDRRRLGWKPPGNQYQISALDPDTREETWGDLAYGQDFSHGSNELVLRDFVTTGDAVRIELPYLQEESGQVSRQWIWLENHQMFPGKLDHGRAARKGIYAYVQVGKEALSGPATYGGIGNYTWPLSALGNFDLILDEKEELYQIRDDRQNPFTGYNNLIFGAWDLKEKDGIIYRDELFLARNMMVNGAFPDSSAFAVGTYPLFGTAMDAFLPGDRIALDQNPAAVPLLTYRTSAGRRVLPAAPAATDNRIIHLNGISVEILEQLADGSMRIRIRWDAKLLQSDVRWCGTIHLHEDLEIDRKVSLLVDQGLTPQKPLDPISFGGQQIFSDPSSLVLQPGSKLLLRKGARLVLDHGSTLFLLEGSVLETERRSRIVIEPPASLKAVDGSIVRGRGKIIVKEGKGTGIEGGSAIQVRVLQ